MYEEELKKIERQITYTKGLIEFEHLTKGRKAFLKDKLTGYKRDLSRLKGNILITDHALVRYLDRIMDVDVEEVRKNLSKILTKEWKKHDKMNGEYPIADTTAIIRDQTLVTMLSSDMR